MYNFYMYILKCSDGSYYIGHTDNLEQRISMHQQKLIVGYTSSRAPVKLLYTQEFGSRYEALAAERQVKKWSRKKKQALIEGNWNLLKITAKKKFD